MNGKIEGKKSMPSDACHYMLRLVVLIHAENPMEPSFIQSKWTKFMDGLSGIHYLNVFRIYTAYKTKMKSSLHRERKFYGWNARTFLWIANMAEHTHQTIQNQDEISSTKLLQFVLWNKKKREKKKTVGKLKWLWRRNGMKCNIRKNISKLL